MNLYNSELYMEDVLRLVDLNIPWSRLQDKSIVLSGSTGLIGSMFVDVIMEKNIRDGLNCTIYALGREIAKISERFSKYSCYGLLKPMEYSAADPINTSDIDNADFLIHLASNTHPMQYSTDPIGTIETNMTGIRNMLDLATHYGAERVLFASSNEIYGENRGDVELFDEDYCGYINSNTLRAGYPESKRCGESLCQAYITQKGIDVVIARFTRTYGPTMKMSDTKALSQFIKKGLAGEDIVLKSLGNQYYSYAYVADSVFGLLVILLLGEKGQAYNIADERSDIRLKDLARIVADYCNTEVVFDVPSEIEASGYSTATKARLNGNKLSKLGWFASYDISSGIKRTMDVLKETVDL